jgi:hypothetical protein
VPHYHPELSLPLAPDRVRRSTAGDPHHRSATLST